MLGRMTARDLLRSAREGLSASEWLPVPARVGAALWRRQAAALAKGAGHKYVRRERNPNPPPKWRYYYRAASAARGLRAELYAGEKFQIDHDGQAGHFEVVELTGDRVTVRHDESGELVTVTRAALEAMFRDHHAEAIDAHRGRLKRDLAAAKKHGASRRQVARLEDEARRHGHEDLVKPRTIDPAGVPLPPPPDLLLVGCVKGKAAHDERVPVRDLYRSRTWTYRRDYAEGRELIEGTPWAVVSAGLGVVDPDRQAKRYEAQAKDLKGAARAKWLKRARGALIGKLYRGEPPETPRRVEVIAGADYVKALREAVEGLPIEIVQPLKGVGLTHQEGWLRDRAAELKAQHETLAEQANRESPGRPEWHGRLSHLGLSWADWEVRHDSAADAVRRIMHLRQSSDGWHFEAAAAKALGEPLTDYNGHPVEMEDDDGESWLEVEPEELPSWFGRPDWTPEYAAKVYRRVVEHLDAWTPTEDDHPGGVPEWATGFLHEVMADELETPPDGLRLSMVSKDEARRFIAKHHSAMPKWNHRGVVFTLGVRDTRGRLVAVATANTPTARAWRDHPRELDTGRTLDAHNVLELTRVASDGTTKGAASMLARRVVALGEKAKRGDPTAPHLVVTYQLASESGTTYRALRDVGLRPVELTRGRKGARRAGGEVDENDAAKLQKLRWEAGPAAMPARWDLLNAMNSRRDPEQLATLFAAERANVALDDYFASGSNHEGEIRGFHRLGINPGVAADRLNDRNVFELKQLAGTGRKVFVDSGAFGEIDFNVPKKGQKGPPRPDLPIGAPFVVKPITDDEWQKRLGRYHELAQVLGGQMYAVAPDKVAHQSETLERLARYAPQVREIAKFGAHVMVPMQKGQLSMPDFAQVAAKRLGMKRDALIWAIPMKKDATTLDELEDFVREAKPGRVHLLGVGPDSTAYPAIRAMFDRVAPGTALTLDSVKITAAVGRDGTTPEGLPKARALTAAQDRVLESVEASTFRADDHELPDYTELAAVPSEWTTDSGRRRLWAGWRAAMLTRAQGSLRELKALPAAERRQHADLIARTKARVDALRADRKLWRDDPDEWMQAPHPLADHLANHEDPAVTADLEQTWADWYAKRGSVAVRKERAIIEAFGEVGRKG